MKRVCLVLTLAVALTMLFAAAAYAEHAPSNFSQWNLTYGDNADVPSPHAGYAVNTVKCSVCHSIHRGAVMGQNIRNQVNGDWVLSSTTAPTEMLLRSNVAGACDYCHIQTATGGVQLYNANVQNRTAASFAEGYGHTESNACTYCHATHGGSSFKGGAGTAGPKIIKYTATQHTRTTELFQGANAGLGTPQINRGLNLDIPANVANHTFTNPATGLDEMVGIEDEIYTEDATGVLVDPLNKAQVLGLEELILGTGALINSAADASMKDVQVGAFCTTCHQNMYAADSFQVLNPDQDSGLWGGTYGVWTTVPGFAYQSGTWKSKGHPVSDATNDFAAQGSTLGTGKTVAWSDADVCRSCHDAGTDDAPVGVVYSSWPHTTPGYYRFMGAGPDAATYATYNVNAKMSGDSLTGGWLAVGAYVNPTEVLPEPNAASGFMLYDGQNYRSDVPAEPGLASHIGVDGLCLKCHVSAPVGAGIGRSF